MDELAAARLSILFWKIDDIPMALRYCEISISKLPSCYGYHSLGKLKLCLGDSAGAYEALSKAMSISFHCDRIEWSRRTSDYCLKQPIWLSDCCTIMVDLGKCLLCMERYSEAADVLSKAQTISPMLPEAASMLARAHVLLGSSNMAREYHDQCAQVIATYLDYNFSGGAVGVCRIAAPLLQKLRCSRLQFLYLDQLRLTTRLNQHSKLALVLAKDKGALPMSKLTAINALIKAKQIQQAEQCLDHFMSRHGTPWATLPIRVQLAIRKQDFNEALAVINQALERYRTSLTVQAQRINILLMLGRAEEAIDAVQDAIDRNPGHLEFYYIKCRIHLRQNNNNQALRAAKEALSIDASHPAAYIHVSRAQFALQLFESALSSAQKAVGMQPTEASHLVHLSRVLQAQRCFSEAMASANMAVGLDPEDPNIKAFRINLALEANELGLALDLAQEAVVLHPQDAGLYIILTRVLLRLQRTEEAEKAACQAVIQAPTSSNAYLWLGRALLSLARFQEAILALNTVVASQNVPDHQRATAYAWLAECLQSSGNVEGAIEAAQHSLTYNPSFALAWYRLSLCLDQHGELDDALNALKQALVLDKSKFGWLLQLSNMYIRLGDNSNALAAAQNAYGLAPEDKRVLRQLDMIRELTSRPSD